MNYITEQWPYGPFLIVAIVVAAWHEIGLRNLALRSRPERTRQRRLRALSFYGGLAPPANSPASPVSHLGRHLFFVREIPPLPPRTAPPTPTLIRAAPPAPPDAPTPRPRAR